MQDKRGGPPLLRQYLLGELGEKDLDRAEERLLEEGALVGELDVVADDLLEDFLQGALTPGDRARFQDHFLHGTGRLEQLRAARLLRDHFLAQLALEPAMAARAEASREKRLRPLQVWRFVAAAAAVLFLVVVLWPAPGPQPQTATVPAKDRELRPSPLAQLRVPERARAVPPRPTREVPLRLLPGQTMGAEVRPEAVLAAGIESLRLELELEDECLEACEVRLIAPGRGEVWRGRAGTGPRGTCLAMVHVPAARLQPAADYRVLLVSRGGSGSDADVVASYSFRTLPGPSARPPALHLPGTQGNI